jgi:hypothetical protein
VPLQGSGPFQHNWMHNLFFDLAYAAQVAHPEALAGQLVVVCHGTRVTAWMIDGPRSPRPPVRWPAPWCPLPRTRPRCRPIRRKPDSSQIWLLRRRPAMRHR